MIDTTATNTQGEQASGIAGRWGISTARWQHSSQMKSFIGLICRQKQSWDIRQLLPFGMLVKKALVFRRFGPRLVDRAHFR